MKEITDLPFKIQTIETVFIPMPDGARLAARLWIPEGAERRPVPAILEYIPYRRRDFTRRRDDAAHAYFAGHGYACARVDLRGAGDSEGVLRDEYLEQELDDGVDVIEWLARQPWCNGRVGMIGISWGGFNGLQIAAKQPPALGAVITLCSTDDRYRDDVHYMGGCLLGENLSWASVMFSYNSCPPDPEVVGDRWRSMWLDRLENSGLWLETWLRHQHRDAYWRHGSICEDFSKVRVPVLAGSGWADGYTNAVFRLLEGLEVPRRGLVGPWSHKYPHLGVPGPAIGFLQEALKWWDQWLKDEPTEPHLESGRQDPMLWVYMQEPMPPSTGYQCRPGRWVSEPSWPSPHPETKRFFLGATGLVQHEEPDQTWTIQSPVALGLFGGKWCSYSGPPDLPDDQRGEDGGALVFDTPTLEERVEVLGAPCLEVTLSSDRPVATLAARLSDVAPDGRVARVSFGLLNLTHRESHEHPEPLEPGRKYRVRLALNYVGQAFEVGHRIRVALSTSYWPIAWPPPEPTRLSIETGRSTLTLPTRTPRPEDEHPNPFGPPEGAPRAKVERRAEGEASWRVIRDLGRDSSLLEVINNSGRAWIEAIDLETEHRTVERYSIEHDDLDSIRGETETVRSFRRAGFSVRTHTRTILTSTSDRFRIRAECDAWHGGTRVFCRSWDREISRQLV